ncbi:DUF4030 domain-containing protein [Priestia megaterium]|uniref:DUF4030 domain-containing protein n=1 Tax=Priestia megaterium TaxID=1404 RepID=UPI001C47569F|nr:DUF4030 domain-containing protein [Priestia megaterium]MBV6738345.1 DUF4030 domain-containing protein [Priestia megaterium]
MKRIRAYLIFICMGLLLSSCQISKADAKDKNEIVGDILENVSNEYPVINYTGDAHNIWMDVEDTVQASEVQKKIQQQLKENGLNGYKVSVRARDVKQVEKEHRWSLIDSYIFEKFRTKEKDEEKYKDVTTKLTDITLEDPATVAISTPIVSSDPKAKEYAEQIKKEVEALLQSKKMKKLIEGDAYNIVVYDEKDQVIIN